jgi:NhaP-type Na+/H+ or K+/H+ antiporter
MIEVASIALVFLIFSLLSRRLASTVISAPMFFLFAGMLLASDLVGLVSFEDVAPALLVVGMAALGLSFFNDASRIKLNALRSNVSLPARLLFIGLPLTFLLGTLLARWLLPLYWTEAALLAVILTPADTGLITVFLNSPRVPQRMRQALNIESSLNDGLTTPIAAILITLSQTRLGFESIGYRLSFPIEQILVALAVGLLVGGSGGWLLRRAMQRQWIVPSFQGLVFPSLTALALTLTFYLKGNYFIACFVGGATLGVFVGDFSPQHSGFAETLTHLLSLVVFLFLGAKVVELWAVITWPIVLYALLSLTVVRMLPVAAAMWGKGLRWESLLCLGWFGPRGLASIVLATIVVGSVSGIPHSETIIATVAATVALSVVLHGVSAIPLIVWYSFRMERLHADSPEYQPVEEIPFRLGWFSSIVEQTDRRISAWETRREPRSDAGGYKDEN